MEELKIEISLSGVESITINRPAVRNSLNGSLVDSLLAAFKKASKDPYVRVIILSGEGETFCAGADLKELHSLSMPKKKRFFKKISELMAVINGSPKPIIAKVHGHALAGGCGLAAACDIVLASDEAIFGLPEIHIGLVPMIVMVPIYRAIGKRALSHLVLTGEIISAPTALSIRLITQIIPKAELNNETLKLAEKLTKKSPVAIAAAKKAITDVGEMNYLKALTEFGKRVGKLCSSQDAEEGITAFLEKRVPNWPSLRRNK